MVVAGVVAVGWGQDSAAVVQAARKAYASREDLKIASARLDHATLGQYERLEVDVDLHATYDNPFDSAQVSLAAGFSREGGGATTIAGFYDIPYAPLTPGTILTGDAPYKRDGAAGWKVRFTPRQAGRYTCKLSAMDRTGKRAAYGPLTFLVTPRKAHGSVRVARGNPRYFEYEDGSLFYPTGANVAWTHEFFRGNPSVLHAMLNPCE